VVEPGRAKQIREPRTGLVPRDLRRQEYSKKVNRRESLTAVAATAPNALFCRTRRSLSAVRATLAFARWVAKSPSVITGPLLYLGGDVHRNIVEIAFRHFPARHHRAIGCRRSYRIGYARRRHVLWKHILRSINYDQRPKLHRAGVGKKRRRHDPGQRRFAGYKPRRLISPRASPRFEGGPRSRAAFPFPWLRK